MILHVFKIVQKCIDLSEMWVSVATNKKNEGQWEPFKVSAYARLLVLRVGWNLISQIIVSRYTHININGFSMQVRKLLKNTKTFGSYIRTFTAFYNMTPKLDVCNHNLTGWLEHSSHIRLVCGHPMWKVILWDEIEDWRLHVVQI